jgi:hypothetical protein
MNGVFTDPVVQDDDYCRVSLSRAESLSGSMEAVSQAAEG